MNNTNNLNLNTLKNRSGDDILLYRAYLNINNDICFYGLSKRGIKSYFEQKKAGPPYNYCIYKLPRKYYNQIIFLNKLKKSNMNKIIAERVQNNLSSLHEALRYNNTTNTHYRYSNNTNIDREFSNILKRLFPDKKGSYTKQAYGKGLSHAEIIIWDKTINDELQSNVIYESVDASTLGIAPPPPTKKSKHRPTRNNGNNGNNGNNQFRRTRPLF